MNFPLVDHTSEIQQQPTTLYPDLETWVDDVGEFQVLKHKLVITPLMDTGCVQYANWLYQQKRKHVADYFEDGKLFSYVFHHERPYRAQALSDYLFWKPTVPNKQYWEVLKHTWSDSENIWQEKELWQELWWVKSERRRYLMDKDEKRMFYKLPDPVKVYRGLCGPENEIDPQGMSWTLDYEKAKWFANRCRIHIPEEGSKVLAGLVPKKHILAILLDRKETEVVVNDGSAIEITETIDLKPAERIKNDD